MAHRWKVLIVTSLGVFMVFLDGTIVNIAFPAIHRSFPSTPQASHSWVLNAYNIVFAALLLASGRIADITGRRRIFFGGLGFFTLGSVLCGLAPAALALDAARALQAIGGAMLLPASLALLLPEFPLSMRATAVGLWGAVGAVAAASGPSLGSVIVQSAGWRWAFLVNAPVGLIGWLAGRHILVESRDPSAGRWPDAAGVVSLSAGMGFLALGIVEGNDWGWSDPRIVAALAASAVLLALCVRRSIVHVAPVIPLALFRVRSFSVANAAAVAFGAAFSAMLLAGVLFLTGVWHYSILRAGLAVTPGPLMAAVFAPIAGRLADRFGHRVVLIPGALLFGAAMLLYEARVGFRPAYLAEWLPAALLSGAGVGLTLPTLGSAAASSLPPARFGAGSAVASTSRQLGFVLGISILVALLGTPDPANALAAFHRAWMFCAAAAATTSIACLALGTTIHGSEPASVPEAA